MLAGKGNVGASCLPPLAQVVSGSYDVFLPADGIRIENDPMSLAEQAIAEVGVLVAEAAPAGKVDGVEFLRSHGKARLGSRVVRRADR